MMNERDEGMKRRPQLLLSFLLKEDQLNEMKRRVFELGGIFQVVEELCSESFDETLGESFISNWRGTLEEEQEQEIIEHGSVLFLQSDDPDAAPLEIAVDALRTIAYLLGYGAIAAKVEGSDMVYSSEMWNKMAEEAVDLELSGNRGALFQLCGFALVRRGIEGDFCYETLGYHFLGLPELHFALESTDQMDILMKTENIAWILFEQGIQVLEQQYGCEWEEDFYHTESDLLYNPYGILSFFEID